MPEDFLRDFGADSVDILELVMVLEESFDIAIGDTEWDRITMSTQQLN